MECTDEGREMRTSTFVNCGIPLPGFEIEIRDPQGTPVPERCCGTVFVRGQSLMSGYFEDPDATKASLSEDGWLNTGDLGYLVDESIFIT